MAYLKPDKPEKVYVPALRAAKEKGEKLVCLTAYDYPTARIVDEAGVDIILVGDSMGNVIHGYDNTIPVTLDEICSATKAVKRGSSRALLVADMPYGSFHTGDNKAVRNALTLMKDGGAEAVKLEGGRNRVRLVKRLVDEEIPVMAHVGLTPQSVHKMGGYRVQAKTKDAAEILIEDAKESRIDTKTISIDSRLRKAPRMSRPYQSWTPRQSQLTSASARTWATGRAIFCLRCAV